MKLNIKKLSNYQQNLAKLVSGKSAGATLVELLLYIGILSVLLVALSAMFFLILDNQARSLANTGLEENSKFLSARLSYDLRRASNITSPAAVGSTTSSLQMTIGDEIYTYSIVGGIMQLASPSATIDLHGSDVIASQLQVTRQGNPYGKHSFQVSYDLDTAQQVSGAAKSVTYQFILGKR